MVAFGAVFEGEEFAEGFDIAFGPVGDLFEGAYAVGVELGAKHAFDAFDSGEVVVLGDAGGLLQGVVQGVILTLQAFQSGLRFCHLGFAAQEALSGEPEAGWVVGFFPQATDTLLPVVVLLSQGAEECLLRGDVGFETGDGGLHIGGGLGNFGARCGGLADALGFFRSWLGGWDGWDRYDRCLRV